MVQPACRRTGIHLPRRREERQETLCILRARHACQLCHRRVRKPSTPSDLYTNRRRQHDHTIPGVNLPAGFLLDYTDRGVLWDPVLNAYSYSYDVATGSFASASDPVAWLNFNGKWGDDQPPNEPSIFGQARNVGGPNGPKFKALDRELVCPSKPCWVLPFRTFANVTGG